MKLEEKKLRKMIREELLKENSGQNVVQYVKRAKHNVHANGGNAINFEAGLEELANHLEAYDSTKLIPSPMEQGWYSKETMDLFKQFVNSFAHDEIEGNQSSKYTD